MYRIEITDYGVRFTLRGFVDQQEILRWAVDVRESTKSLAKGFCIFLDMRGMQPLPPDACNVMEKAQQAAIKAGMKRAVQVVDDPITRIQFKRLARRTGISGIERQIDPSTVPDWERAAMDWLIVGTDPNPDDPAETKIMRAFAEPEIPV